jgi:hypothetical protein
MLGRPKSWILVVTAAAFAGLMTLPAASPAEAGPDCSPRARVLDHLASKYREAPVAIGVTSGGGLLEVLSSGDGLTWTIIVTTPQGMSCLMAAGEGWRPVEAILAEPAT